MSDRANRTPEARLRDGVPVTAGWFVVNARDARWRHDAWRSACRFGGEGEAHFDDLGFGLYWLEPGRPMALYHHEAGQEDFLVLRGTCVAVVEGEERELGPWDLLHCPPRTGHTLVATGDEPALVVAVGARRERGSARYPVEPAAVARGAGLEAPPPAGEDVYGDRLGTTTHGPPPPGFPPW